MRVSGGERYVEKFQEMDWWGFLGFWGDFGWRFVDEVRWEIKRRKMERIIMKTYVSAMVSSRVRGDITVVWVVFCFNNKRKFWSFFCGG